MLTIVTAGEACAHIVGASLSVNAYFDKGDVVYTGADHKKAKVVGDGIIAAAQTWLGGQASIATSVRW